MPNRPLPGPLSRRRIIANIGYCDEALETIDVRLQGIAASYSGIEPDRFDATMMVRLAVEDLRKLLQQFREVVV